MSITSGPAGRVWRPTGSGARDGDMGRERGSRLLLFVVLLGPLDRNLGAVLQFAADRRVTTRDDLLAGLHAALHLDGRVVGDAGHDLALLHHPALFDEDDVVELVPVAPGLLALAGDIELVARFFLGFLGLLLLQLLGGLAAGADGHALHRDRNHVL